MNGSRISNFDDLRGTNNDGARRDARGGVIERNIVSVGGCFFPAITFL